MTEALVHVSSDDNLANIVEELSQQLLAGNSEAIEAILAEHPNEADRLRALLPTLRVLVEIGSSPVGQNGSNATATESHSQESLHPQILGDFRILREIGRGGMGVVFEAEQVSLRRRVALKVLPTASMLDPRSLQRFRNEAQAAASLHHSHIVPIYGVGCERGVHYYAMQYIDGLTIAEVIAKLRESSKLLLDPQAHPQPDTAEAGSQAQLDSKEKQAAETEVMAALSTEKSSNSGAWFRRLAEHMAQVADALHHAHELGVTHRDIKPANLMLDRLGRIWVTDFGLARIEGADNLTMTGDLVGTLRYMSPEQALAKRLGVDHRSDIYSLGITLYELLTLKPAFAGAGRQELLQQLASEEPKSLRKQNPAIPRDLETIVIKATQKNPSERYQTAAELAVDLRHFIDDRHIVARRPSLPVRVMRLAKRHKGVVSTVSVMLLLATIGCLGWAYDYQQRLAKTTRLVNEALEELAIRREHALIKQEDFVAWEHALSVAERAIAIAENSPIGISLKGKSFGLYRQLKQEQRTALERQISRENDLRLVQDLGEARMKLISDPFKTGMHPHEFVLEYAQALSEYGLDLVQMDHTLIEERIRASAIRTDLVYALVALAIVSLRDTNEAKALPDSQMLLAIADATATSMPSIQRTLVVFLQSKDIEKLRKLAESKDLGSYPADAVFCIVTALEKYGEKPLAISMIRSYLASNPDDYFLNAMLGKLLSPQFINLSDLGNANSSVEFSFESSEAIRYLTAAIALRPNTAYPLHSLGVALHSQRRFEESKTAFLKAIEREPDFAPPRLGLAFILAQQGKHNEALGQLREAIRIAPRYPYSYHGLGVLLLQLGRLEEAEAATREAIRLKPNAWFQHKTLAKALRDQNEFDQAIAECTEAIRLDPMQSDLHVELGNCFLGQKKHAAAIDAFQSAISLNSKDSSAHCGLGIAFVSQGKYEESGDALAEALKLDPNHPQAHIVLGRMLLETGKLTEAIQEFQEAVRINPKSAQSYHGLGQALSLQGRFDESADAMQEAARIEPNSAMRLDNLGIALTKKGEFESALNAHREAISSDPNFAPAYRNLASGLLSVGKLEEAEVSCREAIRLRPKDAEAHFILGLVLNARRRFLQAEKAYREALLLNPNHARAMCNLGSILIALGKRKDAVAHFRAAILSDPKLIEARIALGNDLLESGRADEAIVELRVAVHAQPAFFDAHNSLGRALMQKGAWSESIIAFREALRIKPESPEALCNLGLALTQLGNHVEALQVMRKGHQLGSLKPDWPYPSKRWITIIERSIKLSSRYDAIVENGDVALSVADRIELATFALVNKQNPVIALKCFQQAFADDPSLFEDVKAGYRYNAACAAMLTLTAEQKKANQSEDAENVQLPHHALVWLQADVDAFRKLADNAAPAAVPQFISTLAHWEKDPDIESLRDEQQVKKLPAGDQELCKKLWSDHAELLKQLREKQSSVGQ